MDLGSDRIQFLDLDKSIKDAESFYDCRICMDVATDPVVTCCGHLFCWSCLYRWLNTGSSIAKLCPICKGDVAVQNLTPINGCGVNGQKPEIGTSLSLKVPPRPQARRVENMKESIRKEGFTLMEELIRRLSQKYDLAEIYAYGTSQERTNSFLSRVLTSRGMRGEQSNLSASEEAARFLNSRLTNTDTGVTPQHDLTFTTAFPSTEDLVGSDLTTNPEMPGNDWLGLAFSANDNEPGINGIDGGQMLEATNATESETENRIIEALYETSIEINSEPESRVLEAQAANDMFHGHPFQAAETAPVEINSGLPFQAVEAGLVETVDDVDNRASQAEPHTPTPETVNELDAGDSPSTSSLRRFYASTILDLDDGYSRMVRRRIG